MNTTILAAFNTWQIIEQPIFRSRSEHWNLIANSYFYKIAERWPLAPETWAPLFLQYLDYNCFIIKKIKIVPWFWHCHFLPLSFLVILNFMNILALSFGHFWRSCLRAQTQPTLFFIKNATGGNSGGEGLHDHLMTAGSFSATYKIKNFKIFEKFCWILF